MVQHQSGDIVLITVVLLYPWCHCSCRSCACDITGAL